MSVPVSLTNHYPSVTANAPYTPLRPPLTTVNPYFPSLPHVEPLPEPPRPASPVPPAVTPEVASQAVQRLIASELQDSGFTGSHPEALYVLEQELVAFVQQLYQRAHEYANLSNRSGPIATDLLLAGEEFDVSPKELRPFKSKLLKRKRKGTQNQFSRAPSLVPPPSRSPSPDLLPSDDESIPQVVPVTLRNLPANFPSLPPKHTYLQTPASPPKKAALPSLEKKLKTAGLVQDSLKNLLLATEDSSNQEDAELLGHIVNWETNVHPRKRWRV